MTPAIAHQACVSGSTRPVTEGRMRRRPSRTHTQALVPSGGTARRLARILYVTLVACAAVAMTLSRAVPPERPAPAAWSAITVGDSSSLWTLAETHAVQGLSTAETVDIIIEANGLTSTVVTSGMTLLVPDASTEQIAVASR